MQTIIVYAIIILVVAAVVLRMVRRLGSKDVSCSCHQGRKCDGCDACDACNKK